MLIEHIQFSLGDVFRHGTIIFYLQRHKNIPSTSKRRAPKKISKFLRLNHFFLCRDVDKLCFGLELDEIIFQTGGWKPLGLILPTTNL